MTKLTVNADMQAKIAGLNDFAELCDESGRTLGYFFPPGTLTALSPFSDEEIERRRKDRSGRPLSDILKDLEGRS
jgi:hypothetical protein